MEAPFKGGWESLYAGVGRQERSARPTRPTALRAYANVARFEYLPAEVLLITIPVLLVFRGPEDILNIRFAETAAVFFLLYFTGFMANALADRRIDATYKSYKARVALSVQVLGVGRLTALLVAHVVAALCLSVHLFMATGNWLVLALVGLGLFLGVGYSMGPLHFKTRGVAHGLALAISAFFLPLAFIVVTMSGRLDVTLLLFMAGFTMAMYSLEFGNQAMDFFEDQRANVRTPSVRYSVRSTVAFSLVLLTLGLALTSMTLGSILEAKMRPIHPIFSELSMILAPTILVVGFLGPAIGLGRIYQGARPTAGSADIDARRMRSALRTVDHPRWQASGAMGVVIVCALMFVGALFPATLNGPVRPVDNVVPDVWIKNTDTVVNAGDTVDLEAVVINGGNVRTLTWNFGDNTATSGSLKASHIYKQVGVYNVNFTVTDKFDRQVSHSINITVTKLFFSKLELKAKKFLTYTHIDYDFNVTNDKDLKQRGELMVEMYYQDFQVLNQTLGQKLYPAKVWPGQGTLDLMTLDKDIAIKVLLIQWVGSNQVEVEEHTVRPG